MELISLSKDFIKLGVIDVFDSLLWTDRYDKTGDFEIFVKPNSNIFSLLRKDNYLLTKASDHIMIIETINLKTNIEKGDQFIVKGRSLESIIERRIIWKQTILSGSFQEGIKRLLDENAINPDDPDRKISRLVFEYSDELDITNLSIDEQYDGQNLYITIQELCESRGIGFKITLSDTDNFVFKLYTGKDRSKEQNVNSIVIFSPEFNNLLGSDYFYSTIPHKTIALVSGEGEGSERISTQISLNNEIDSDLDRRELFVDARDISTIIDGEPISIEEYYTQLTQRGLLHLLNNQEISSFDGEVSSSINYVYGIDYFMGDVIQTENIYNLESKARIIELIFSENLSGIKKFPTFKTI